MSAPFHLDLPGLLDQKGLLGPKVHKAPLARPVLKVQRDPRAQRGRKARRGPKARRGHRDRRELEWLLRFRRTPLLVIKRSFRIRERSTPQRGPTRSFPTPVPSRTPPRAPRHSEAIQLASTTMLLVLLRCLTILTVLPTMLWAVPRFFITFTGRTTLRSAIWRWRTMTQPEMA